MTNNSYPQKPGSFFRKKSVWALALGIAIGGVAVSSLTHFPGTSSAYASDQVNSRLAGLVDPSSMATLKELDHARIELAQAVMPSVVLIKSSTPANDNQGFMPSVKGEGSGVIIRPNGYILTNDHVVNGFSDVTVELKDGRTFPGKVIRSDQSGDVAVVKIDASDLPAIPMADSDSVEPGESVMAVGAPFGLQNTVTFGHISALHRSQMISDPRMPQQVRYYPDLLQTDAAINPGNSGGALVNMEGELVGINTAIASNDGASNGVGFAIPSSDAQLIADMLISKGKIVRPYLDVDPEPLKEFKAKQLGISNGAFLNIVETSGPAYAAGLRKGDVVTQIDNVPIKTYMDLRNKMLLFQPGQTVKVTYFRDGKYHTASVKLASQPAAVPQSQNRQQQRQMSPFGSDPFKDFKFPKGFQFNMPDGPNPGGNQSGSVDRSGKPRLGAQIAAITDDIRAQYDIPKDVKGVVVMSVEPNSDAARLGIQPGDVIRAFDGHSLASPQDLVNAENGIKWGETHSVRFQRWKGQGNSSVFSMDFHL